MVVSSQQEWQIICCQSFKSKQLMPWPQSKHMYVFYEIFIKTVMFFIIADFLDKRLTFAIIDGSHTPYATIGLLRHNCHHGPLRHKLKSTSAQSDQERGALQVWQYCTAFVFYVLSLKVMWLQFYSESTTQMLFSCVQTGLSICLISLQFSLKLSISI